MAVILLQHAINVLNDAADWRLGADVEKWDSWVRYHHEDTSAALRHGGWSFVAGGSLGLAVLAWIDRWWILALAAPLVGLGLLYNAGRKPLSYTRLAEWATGLCYGPGVFGCLWLVVEPRNTPAVWLGSLAFGCLAVALLLSHQPPQITTDRQAGKRSFAARHGAKQTYAAVRLLMLGFLISWGLALGHGKSPGAVFLYLPLSLLVCPLPSRSAPSPKHLLVSTTSLLAAVALGSILF